MKWNSRVLFAFFLPLDTSLTLMNNQHFGKFSPESKYANLSTASHHMHFRCRPQPKDKAAPAGKGVIQSLLFAPLEGCPRAYCLTVGKYCEGDGNFNFPLFGLGDCVGNEIKLELGTLVIHPRPGPSWRSVMKTGGEKFSPKGFRCADGSVLFLIGRILISVK